MDNELENIETELKALRPAAVSHRFVQRVARALENEERSRRRTLASIHWLRIGLASAAAAAAVLLLQAPTASLPRREAGSIGWGSAPREDAELKPVAAEKLLVAAQDEGLVTLQDGTPARRARLRYVDTITWRNSRTNASLTWTVPREEVRIVPVVFQ
jgi:hypothetical protein